MKYYFLSVILLTQAITCHAMDERMFVEQITVMQREHKRLARIFATHAAHYNDNQEARNRVSDEIEESSRNLIHAQKIVWRTIARAMNASNKKTQEHCRKVCLEHAQVLNYVPVETLAPNGMRFEDQREPFIAASTLMILDGLHEQRKNEAPITLLLGLGAMTTYHTQCTTPFDVTMVNHSLLVTARDNAELNPYLPLLLTYSHWIDAQHHLGGKHPVVDVYHSKDLSKPETHSLIRLLAQQHYFVGQEDAPMVSSVVPECIVALGRYIAQQQRDLKLKNRCDKDAPALLETFEVVARQYYDRAIFLETGRSIDQNAPYARDIVVILNDALRKDYEEECRKRANRTHLIDQSFFKNASEPFNVAQILSDLITDYLDVAPERAQIPLIDAPKKRCCNPGMMVYHALATVGRISKLWKRD